MILRTIRILLGGTAMLWGAGHAVAQQQQQQQPDPGKKACVQEARRLCPAEMKSLSRKKVEACMIAKIDQTSPGCHAAMLRIKAQREASAKR